MVLLMEYQNTVGHTADFSFFYFHASSSCYYILILALCIRFPSSHFLQVSKIQTYGTFYSKKKINNSGYQN